MRKVEVVPHDLNWRSIFQIESEYIAVVLDINMIAIHHIGSTAIETIYAKPKSAVSRQPSAVSRKLITDN